MHAAGISGAKRRLLERLVEADSATAPELAAAFGLTDTAVRQHLEVLESAGLVERVRRAAHGRGRPPVHWRLTPSARTVLPDRHGDLTVELLESIRTAVGDDGLSAVLAARADRQAERYAQATDASDDVLERLRALARARSAEGYVADVLPTDPATELATDRATDPVSDPVPEPVEGAALLVEHHCPIASAALACGDLCETELAVFRRVLGPEVAVERTDHLMAGDRRCAYRVTFRPGR